MRRYFRLLNELFRVSLIREMEFRGNFFIQFILELFWIAIQLFTITIFFTFTDEIIGWSKYEVIFLFGIYRLIKGIFDFAFYENLFSLSETINKGELDYLLTRPVNTLFLVSFQTMTYTQLSEVIISLSISMYAYLQLNIQVAWYLWIIFIISVFIGLLIYYCLILLFSTLAFFTTRLTALSAYQDIIKHLLRYPIDIFRSGNRFLALSTLILAFVATFPVKILFSKLPPVNLGLQIIGSIVLVFLCLRFWNFALGHYSSASS